MAAGTRAARRKRLLLVTRNLPPLIGGMERFNERVLAQLSKDFDVAVCGPAGCEEFLPAGTPVVSIGIRPLPIFLLRMAFASLRMARRFQPDLVIAGSGLTAPIAWLVARCFRIRALVFLYGLDLVVSSRWYQRLWLPAIRRCDGFLAISRHTHSLALAQKLDDSRIRIFHPGVDPPVDMGRSNVAQFRETYGLGDRPILLSVGRLTARKGIVEFIKACLPEIIRNQPNAMFAVIGGEAVDALAGSTGSVAAAARDAARALGLEQHVLLLGSVSDATVQTAYRASRVHVFPIRDIPGDVEGFGMVALEAAIVGIPSVAFAVGGVPDAIAPGVSGTLVQPGDYESMADAVLRFLDPAGASWNDDQRRACIEFGRRFEWDKIGVQLNEAVTELAGF